MIWMSENSYCEEQLESETLFKLNIFYRTQPLVDLDIATATNNLSEPNTNDISLLLQIPKYNIINSSPESPKALY